jgi:hypothetical protein
VLVILAAALSRPGRELSLGANRAQLHRDAAVGVGTSRIGHLGTGLFRDGAFGSRPGIAKDGGNIRAQVTQEASSPGTQAVALVRVVTLVRSCCP